jgi:hypothetical protein
MDFVLGMFFGMFVSYVVVKFVVWRTMHEINQMLGYDFRARLREAIDVPENVDKIETRLEDIDGMFYIYNKHNGEFLAQGATASDLITQIKQRFANHEIVISAGEPQALKRFKESSIT